MKDYLEAHRVQLILSLCSHSVWKWRPAFVTYHAWAALVKPPQPHSCNCTEFAEKRGQGRKDAR